MSPKDSSPPKNANLAVTLPSKVVAAVVATAAAAVVVTAAVAVATVAAGTIVPSARCMTLFAPAVA